MVVCFCSVLSVRITPVNNSSNMETMVKDQSCLMNPDPLDVSFTLDPLK